MSASRTPGRTDFASGVCASRSTPVPEPQRVHLDALAVREQVELAAACRGNRDRGASQDHVDRVSVVIHRDFVRRGDVLELALQRYGREVATGSGVTNSQDGEGTRLLQLTSFPRSK